MKSLGRKIFLISAALIVALPTLGELIFSEQKVDGIALYAVSYDIGKFHRADSHLHEYSSQHPFRPTILPDEVPNPRTNKELSEMASRIPKIERLEDGSYRFFFYTGAQLVSAMERAVSQTGQKISRLYVNAHGLPGGNLIPRDVKHLLSPECVSFRQSQMASDQTIYRNYYGDHGLSPKESFKGLIQYSNDNRKYSGTGRPEYVGECSTNIIFWESVAKKVPLYELFAPRAKVSFMTCHQALGNLGLYFMKRFTKIIFPGDRSGQVVGLEQYGMNDWSMTHGMGATEYYQDVASFERMKKSAQTHEDRQAMMPMSVVYADKHGAEVIISKRVQKVLEVK